MCGKCFVDLDYLCGSPTQRTSTEDQTRTGSRSKKGCGNACHQTGGPQVARKRTTRATVIQC
eukprot:4431031-Prorocentrum_lima.AAC.1